MKTIDPISIWVNGKTEQAAVLNAYAVQVTLNSSATFYYSLLSVDEFGKTSQALVNGNLIMSGADYLKWDLDKYVWDWVAEQLSLVITGEYIEAVELSAAGDDSQQPI